MILIGLGSNTAGPWGTPHETVSHAIAQLGGGTTKILAASKLIVTAPLGGMDQADYVNAVVKIATDLGPEALMQHLHDLELLADRRRTVRWGPRTLDLDLLDFNGVIKSGQGRSAGHQAPLVLPHPGIAAREFVLGPIAEIAPDWRHPVLGRNANELLAILRGSTSG